MRQIQLSNHSFEGDNNVYLFNDGPRTVLVDTGDWMSETEDQLRAALAEDDVAFSDVDQILLTHFHGDHVGLARTIQDESDCSVHVHAADAPLVAGEDEAWKEVGDLHERYLNEWGMPPEKQAVLEEIFGHVPVRENPPEVTPFEDGERFSFNGITLTAVHAPGHAAGLCLYTTEVDGESIAFTGDALLPKYTPNVGGADVRVDRPLAKYLETLEEIARADYDRAWPGHRGVIEDPTARAETIIDHHEERAYRVLEALDRIGPADAWTVSADLFGELEHIHILHGPGEAFAHLEHLEAEELVVREGDRYRLAPGVSGDIDARSDERWHLSV